MSKPIIGRKFVDALVEAGILHEPGRIHRVVIDARAGEVVRLYVERIGDDRLLNVALTLDGVQINESREVSAYHYTDPGTGLVSTLHPHDVAVEIRDGS